MVNLTASSILFNKTDGALDAAIRAALRLAADTTLAIYGLNHVNLMEVTTKTNLQAAFAKFVRLRVLVKERHVFGQEYVNFALDAYRQKAGHLTEIQFTELMLPTCSGALKFRRSYANVIRPGIGLFLVALHSSGAITLPASFSWPSVRIDGATGASGRWREVGKLVSSELLQFIRNFDSHSDTLPHPAFETIGVDRKRREWFLTNGTKLLLAAGWHKAEDVNIEDLLAIKAAERAINPRDTYKVLLDVLKRAFGDRVRVTVDDWTSALRAEFGRGARAVGETLGINQLDSVSSRRFQEAGARSDHDLMEELLRMDAVWGKPARIKSLSRLPGLEVDIRSMSSLWLQLEELYVQKTARESYKQINGILGWWNIYLIYYLPYWFARNPTAPFAFPSSPSLLIKSVFVSRLLPSNEETPLTFMEFMNAHRERRAWKNSSYYGYLIQLQGFFEFIERNSDELPNCAGFTQPLSPYDYPPTSRPKSTKKQPVPRRFFGIYLNYLEALIAYHHVVTNRVLSGELDGVRLQCLTQHGVIDTFSNFEDIGFIPILFTSTKTIALQFIPNVLDPKWRTLKDGRQVLLPHPHALHQNLVALHTGLRHNHIQWLDYERFDSRVHVDDNEFALLYVNTDKEKTEPWTPYVSMRVIEVLRAQRDWANLIDEEGFDASHFYNNNPSTKWPRFRPLFAYAKAGKPHGDQVYAEAWRRTLCGLQGLLPELAEFGRLRPLLKLLPPGHRQNDPELKAKLKAFGAGFGAGEHCPLNVATAITPHSARVTVVGQYITYLPADVIGKWFTGQKPRTVSYYVHLDRETVEAEQAHQAAYLRYAALRGAYEPVVSGQQNSPTYIHADRVNSNLARSMRANLEETLVSYGCVSISYREESKNGIDILRETRGADAVANKTEICPYGNNCPQEVVRELRGMHRCSLCWYAVRTIDHLPPVIAKKRQMAEMVDELESLLSTDTKTLNTKYTPEELDLLEEERGRMCEELTGWILNEEVLEVTKQRIARGQSDRKWIVQKPEIIERDLQRVTTPTSMTEYTLARLGECIAYPTMESPQIRARFDLLRRELLARAGNLRAAFASDMPVDPAAECAALLKSVVASTGMSLQQLAEYLDRNQHLQDLPPTTLRLLGQDEKEEA